MINAYFFYRLSNILYRFKIPFLPTIIKGIIFLIYNSVIPYQAKIGKGTRFAYGGIGVVIHKRAVIGTKCVIGTNVTIGGKSGHYQVPIIGNNVDISTGAKILGLIKIDSNATIGANAVAIKNVEDNTVVVGVPAKKLNSFNKKN